MIRRRGKGRTGEGGQEGGKGREDRRRRKGGGGEEEGNGGKGKVEEI